MNCPLVSLLQHLLSSKIQRGEKFGIVNMIYVVRLFRKSRTKGCYLDTSKFDDGNVFPTVIGTKPSFEYNFFDVHLLLVLFLAFILFRFLQYIITSEYAE